MIDVYPCAEGMQTFGLCQVMGFTAINTGPVGSQQFEGDPSWRFCVILLSGLVHDKLLTSLFLAHRILQNSVFRPTEAGIVPCCGAFDRSTNDKIFWHAEFKHSRPSKHTIFHYPFEWAPEIQGCLFKGSQRLAPNCSPFLQAI